ncbi:hypothetical protein ES703_57685 [subsurface metagenome]
MPGRLVDNFLTASNDGILVYYQHFCPNLWSWLTGEG